MYMYDFLGVCKALQSPVALEHPRKSSRLFFLGVTKGLLRVYWGF